MRLKLAEVLVSHSHGISPFVTYERAGLGRGSEIYDAHEALWSAYVFVHPELKRTPGAVDQVVAYLACEMGVHWDGFEHLGPRPDQWPLRLAIAEIEDEPVESKIDTVFSEHQDALASLAARTSKFPTYKGLKTKVKAAIKSA
jgi:hypothetical protein